MVSGETYSKTAQERNSGSRPAMPFLCELAGKIYKQHPRLDAVTIIFPNRRAILYFKKYLNDLLSKPAFAPRLLTIEDFISDFSDYKIPDKLELIHRLYTAYHDVTLMGNPEEIESFDQFYFWGDMLLRDFDEVDKYMIDAQQLFKDLSHQKELDASFDFLTEEQQKFLKDFWGNFDEGQSANKRKFIHVWRKLAQVYHTFKDQLIAERLAYDGMMHKAVAEKLKADPTLTADMHKGSMHFAGFNALTRAEEHIIAFFVEKGIADVHWDIDEYYVNNITQEAGKFFREYQQHPILGKTFPADIPSNFLRMNVQGNEGDQGRAGSETRIKIFGAAQPIGQSKVMSQVLQENLMKGMSPEETLIVLPDEKLLLPVLHGVSSSVEKLNVTMGFPLASTPMFNFIELLADLQLNYKNDHFNHRQALAVLGHPYVVAADPVSSHNKRKEILRHNWVHIPRGYLASETQLHRLIFIPFFQGDLSSYSLVGAALMHYLKSIITEIGSLNSISALDKEYAFQFFKFLNRMEEVLYDEGVERTNGAEGAEEDEENKIGRNLAKGPDATTDRESLKLIHRHLKSFLRIFRQLVRAHKIPFSGEPLKGLQVMGVLETRNLDFKNVFILSLNEGAFPSITSKGSYIPYNIRKAYQLPTVEHQDAIYSYLFYRTLQRAENIFLFYNSETDLLGQGEMSRYLQQLLYESGLPVTKKILHNPVEPQALVSIVINKNEKVLETLARLNDGNMYFKGISPSALNTYLECRLKFYLRHVARIKEPYAVEEELDARVLGNFLHDVMERFYKRIEARKHSKQIETADFMGYEAAIDTLIDEVFIEAYRLDPNKKVTYEGQRLVVREIVKRFAHRIVEMDKKYAPFVMEALEQEGLTFSVPIAHAPHRAVLGGKIDRVDRKEDLLRIIDYKTGKDELDFDSVASLFARDGRRNKAAFQTLLYALLYKSHAVHGESRFRIIPGLINRMNLFDDSFTFGLKVGRQHVNDVEPLLPEFRQRLEELFNDLFDPAQPFDQTSDTEACKLCPYTSICYR